MPQRTNDFQRLVRLVEQALLPRGAKVTESAMVKNAAGDTREIDVLAETDVGPFRMLIAFEAKDHRRPLDVTQIEAIASKYGPGDGLRVNQVVVVSRMGFTQKAKDFAARHTIKLLTLRQAECADWPSLVKASPRSSMIHKGGIHLGEIVFPVPFSMGWQEVLKSGTLDCSCCRKPHRSFSDAVDQVIKAEHQNLLNDRRADCLVIETPRCLVAHLDVKFGKNTRLSVGGESHPLPSVRLNIHVRASRSPLEVSTYCHEEVGGIKRFVQHISSHSPLGGRFQMVVPTSKVGVPRQIAIDISNLPILARPSRTGSGK